MEELKQFNKYITAEDLLGLCDKDKCEIKSLNIKDEEDPA